MSTLRQLRTRTLRVKEGSWIHSAPPAVLFLVSGVAGFVVFATSAMWGWLAVREGWELLPMVLVSDAIAGGLTGFFVYTVLRNLRLRRLAMLQRLTAIRQMNHEIRNALDLIQLSAYTTQHKQAIGIITNAVDRIQWTLREIATPYEWDEKAPSSRGETSPD